MAVGAVREGDRAHWMCGAPSGGGTIPPEFAALAAADPQTVGLIIADIEPHSRPFDLRGWDARMKAVVSGEYASLFGLGEPLAPGTKWRVVHGGSLV
ncbi:hypothetical protein D2F01_24590 [Mycobacteroides abscessus]|nr:hypothetical protein D2F01_24590 [Mycobacteroides abscessus]